MARQSVVSALACGLLTAAAVATGCVFETENSSRNLLDNSSTSGSASDKIVSLPTGVIDSLSVPAKPTLEQRSFHSAKDCAGCHPQHYQEWSLTRHARAMVDPVFRALTQRRRLDMPAEEDPFCTQCHSAICNRSGDCSPGFEFDKLTALSLEGVTCESCHKVSEVKRPYNSGHVLEPTGPMIGPLENTAPNSFHESAYGEHFEQAQFCGGCHDVFESNGLRLEQPFAEWEVSPARGENKTCQDCHMPTYSGVAATGAPTRDGLHRHTFVGVDLPLEGDVDEETIAAIDQRIQDLLEGAATISLGGPQTTVVNGELQVQVTVRNLIDGHNFPTGTTFIRQAWIDIEASAAQPGVTSKVLYRSGNLDASGDLRDHWSEHDPYGDTDLVRFGSSLLDEHGEPQLFSWKATEHRSQSIPPLHERTHTYFISAPPESGKITITAKLKFRSYPPHLLRRLGATQEVHLRNHVRTLASSTIVVEVEATSIR